MAHCPSTLKPRCWLCWHRCDGRACAVASPNSDGIKPCCRTSRVLIAPSRVCLGCRRYPLAVPDHSPKGAGANPRTPAPRFFPFSTFALCSAVRCARMVAEGTLGSDRLMVAGCWNYCSVRTCERSFVDRVRDFARPPGPHRRPGHRLAPTIATENCEKES